MLQISDIEIGKIHFIVKIKEDDVHFEVNKIKPTRVFMDVGRLGDTVILIENEYNPCFRHWQPRRNDLNESSEFRKEYPYIFDSWENASKFIDNYLNQSEK